MGIDNNKKIDLMSKCFGTNAVVVSMVLCVRFWLKTGFCLIEVAFKTDLDSITHLYFRSDLWEVIENTSNKLSKIDWVRFATQDVVYRLQEHFQNIRLASKK